MGNSERICIQWNEFQNIVCSAFEELRNEHELTDVTLVCGGGEQMEAKYKIQITKYKIQNTKYKTQIQPLTAGGRGRDDSIK